jgi:hypothetical protein
MGRGIIFKDKRKLFLIVGMFLILLIALNSEAGILSPELQSTLPSLSDQDEISVIVTFSDRPNVHLIKDQNRRLRRSKIIKHLKEKAGRSQRPVRALLENRGAKGIKSLFDQWTGC